jgi:predicted kinase
MLIVFGGLPGTGKTTLARAIAQERKAVYLRIDTIEQALLGSAALTGDIGPAGYVVAYALAESNLHLGQTVVADAVNPVIVTREAWRRVAAATSAHLIEIEVICSDAAEHRRRIETRAIDVPGLVPLTWQDILDGDYQPWDRPRIVLDTAHRTVAESIDELRSLMERASPRR